MTTTTATWNQLGNTLVGENDGDQFGYSVSINGDGSIVAIGAIQSEVDTNNPGDDPGSTTMYKYNTTTNEWDQLGQILYGEASEDYSGHSVSLNCIGNIVAIGAYQNDGTDSTNSTDDRGHVRVYEYNALLNQWIKLGQDIDGEVAIGAYLNDGNGNDSGHVRVYEYNSSSQLWVKLGQDINGEASRDNSGWSVSLNSAGTIVAIGALNNDGADTNTLSDGHVRVYEYNSSSQLWVQLGQDIDGEAFGDRSGYSVSLNSMGNIVAIGGFNNDGADTNTLNDGHVRVYQYNSSSQLWVQLGQDIDGEATGDVSGQSVSLNNCGNIVAIGAPNNDGNVNNSGHVRVYEYNSSSQLWVKLGQDIDGEAAGHFFGSSVSSNNSGGIFISGTFQPQGGNGYAKIYQLDCTKTLTSTTTSMYPGKLSVSGHVNTDSACQCDLFKGSKSIVQKCFKNTSTYISNLSHYFLDVLGGYGLNQYNNYTPDGTLLKFQTAYPNCETFLIGDTCSTIYPAVLEWSGTSFTVVNTLSGLGFKADTPYIIYGPVSLDSENNTGFTITFTENDLLVNDEMNNFINTNILEFVDNLSVKICNNDRTFLKNLSVPDYSKVVDDYCIDARKVCLKLSYDKQGGC
jgi:hypothetical protein